MIRVMLVEDDEATRAHLARAVAAHPELQLCGEAASLAQARSMLSDLIARNEPPDALLTDLGLPDGSGLELIAHTSKTLPTCDILVISMFGDEDNVLASIRAGASGYLHKDAGGADIAQSILQLKAGASPMSPMIARRVLASLRANAQAAVSSPEPTQSNHDFLKQNQPLPGINPAPSAINSIVSTDSPQLSKRETQVLEYIARGFSYAEVADLAHVSVHTVQTHIKNIYGKLSVHNRSEAVFEAQRLGLLPR